MKFLLLAAVRVSTASENSSYEKMVKCRELHYLERHLEFLALCLIVESSQQLICARNVHSQIQKLLQTVDPQQLLIC